MFWTRDDDAEFGAIRRSYSELVRHSAGWKVASFAGLILVLGAGCKDSHSGKGDIEDDGSVSGDSGSNPTPDGSVPDSGLDSGGGNQSDATVPDGSVPDATNGGGDGGDGDGGDGGGGGDTPDGDTPDGGGGDTPDGGGDTGDAGDAGPGSILSGESVEFGPVPCGGDAPTAKTFSLSNTGPVAVTYSVALSSTTAFSIEGSPSGTKSGTVAPGTDATITINASAVPTSATAGQAITATATVTTNLPAPNNQFVVPLSVVPQGAHLTLSSAGAPEWLLVQVNQLGAPKNVVLQNTGNVQAAVTVEQPDEASFGLKYNNELANMFIVPPAADGEPGAATLVASFAPTVIAGYQDLAPLTVAGPVCDGGTAASLSSISLRGAANGEGLSMDFVEPLENRVNCGATGAAIPKATIQIGNNTTSSLLLAISTTDGVTNSKFLLSKDAMNLASGATDTFDVSLKAAYATADQIPGAIHDDLLLITPQGGGLNPIFRPISTTVQGAKLTVTVPPAFANATNIAPVTQPITVTNTGNLAASPVFSISGTNAAQYTVALTPSEVPVAGTANVSVTFTPPVGDIAAKNATLVLTPGPADVICTPLPTPVALTGAASTSGFQLVSANPVNFEPVCPLQGVPGPFTTGPETVKIKNVGNTLMKWSAVLDDPTRFTLSLGGLALGTDEQDLATTAEADIVVTPVPLTLPASTADDNYGATLTITTDVPGDSPHLIRLAQTAQGAIVAVSGTPLSAFAPVNVVSETAVEPLFSLVNTGNIATTVNVTSTVGDTTGNAAYYVGANPAARYMLPASNAVALAADNTPVELAGLFDPVYPAGSFVDYDENRDLVTSKLTSTFSAPGPLCAALPGAIVITGNGTNAVSGVSATSVDFSASPADRQVCGGVRAAKPKTIVVTNYGNQVLRIDGVSLDDSTYFSVYVNSVGNNTADVPPLDALTGTPGSAVVVVSPKVIASTSSGTQTGTATLTIATSIGGTPTTGAVALPTVSLSNSVVCP